MKKYLSVTLAILLVLLVIVPVTGSMAASGEKTVKITTKDPYTNKAVGSVTVDVWSIKTTKDGTKEECVASVKTNSKGAASVSLAPGSYKLYIANAPDGYATYTSTKLPLPASSENTSVKLSVYPYFTCKIKVVDAKGKAVSGAVVKLNNAGYRVSGKTNSKGIAKLEGVLYGKNNIIINKKVKVVSNNGKQETKEIDYRAYDDYISLKSGVNTVLTETITLPEQSEWRPESSYGVLVSNK